MPAIMPHQTIQGHTEEVRGVVHLPGERHIITCSLDGSLRLWDLKNGTQIGEDWRDGNDAVWSMALSPNGKIIATGGYYDIRLWDVKTRKVIAKWKGHTGAVESLCWSGDGERVASGSIDGTARVWDVNSGKNILEIKTGHKWVRAVTYSPDSSKLATGGNEEHAATVKILDAKTGELLNTLKHDVIVWSLAWTSDGKKLISGSYGPIRIFDTATWQQIAIIEGHTDHVTAISLSPNNRLLASTSIDTTARLWNLDTILPVGPPLQHEQDLRSVALSPDAKVLVTACENKNAYAWDIYAILKEAGLEDLLSIRTPRSSLDNKSFLDADATQCPGQFGGGGVEHSHAFFAGMGANVNRQSSIGGAHPHSSVNALLARLSSLLGRFRPDNGESTELPQPSRPLAFHIDPLLARLSLLIHPSPPENDAPDLQQPSTPSRVDPRVLLARLSSFLHRSRFNIDEDAESHSTTPLNSRPDALITRLSSFLHRSRLNLDEDAESHSTTPLNSRPDALITRLSSLFRSQPHTNEEIELAQRPNRPRVVDVAAMRDRETLFVARGPQFEKAKRAHEQAQLHAQAQASSSHTQPANASTSATHPAPGAAAAQPPPIPWWAHVVLFLCCASPRANGR